MKIRERRPPYRQELPATHNDGFNQDLHFAIKEVAEEHGARVGLHIKNGDLYIAVLLETNTALNRLRECEAIKKYD